MARRWIAGAALAAMLLPVMAVPALAQPASATAPPPDITSAPTLVAHTRDGDVGYRDIGSGSPILMIVGSGAGMDNWDPPFLDALAASHRVVVIDNEGVGDTSAVSAPVTITKMAEQASGLITTLRLRRPAVFGWSMGGMIAQALAVLRPWQVGRLILAATQPGDGRALPIPQSTLDKLGSTDLATVIGLLFPAGQEAAGLTYFEDIFQYPNFYAAPPAVASEQLNASLNWIAGNELTGHLAGLIGVPALVADGTEDAFDPVQNSGLLARQIPRARLVLYPDAGHGFLFQDAAQFLPLVEAFIAGRLAGG